MDILIEEFEENIWAVALENGKIEGLEIDPPNELVRWGSIYWAKINRIDTSLDAVFLDLDGENSGILYNQDTRYIDKDGKICKGGSKSIAKSFRVGDFVAVQAKNVFLNGGDYSQNPDFQIENKIAQMSMDITLSGRYLVYCTPVNDVKRKNGISSRIRDRALRKKLEDMINSIDDMDGFILRSSAADLQTEILQREARILKEMWEQISQYFTGTSPVLIALGPDSIQRILSDQAIKPIESIEVVTMDHFSQVEDWCYIFAPDLITKITPLELEDAVQDLALLEYRDILGQIKSLFHDYALLPGGGNFIIQQTAALTAIDVNKGNNKSKSNLNINIDAAYEIARQIRLRNIGGVIIIDFLKMNKSGEKLLLKELEKAINQDPCTVQIHGFTKLGLMELTRKRRTPSLNDRLRNINIDF